MENSEIKSSEIMMPVDRERRYRFVFFVTMFTLISSMVFTVVSSFGFINTIYLYIITAYIESMHAIATATILGYIGGSVIDYSVGLPRMLDKPKGSAKNAQ